jgi:RNA polymerase-binding protein DksA
MEACVTLFLSAFILTIDTVVAERSYTVERQFVEAQKERLLALRQEMSEKVEQVQENVAQGLAPSDAIDQEEVAVINNMRQIDMAGGDLFEDRIYEIDQALKRIEDGSYGTCDRCGRPINPERLEAKPWATFCITCQEALDAGG